MNYSPFSSPNTGPAKDSNLALPLLLLTISAFTPAIVHVACRLAIENNHAYEMVAFLASLISSIAIGATGVFLLQLTIERTFLLLGFIMAILIGICMATATVSDAVIEFLSKY